jgi:hypothetical protein
MLIGRGLQPDTHLLPCGCQLRLAIERFHVGHEVRQQQTESGNVARWSFRVQPFDSRRQFMTIHHFSKVGVRNAGIVLTINKGMPGKPFAWPMDRERGQEGWAGTRYPTSEA